MTYKTLFLTVSESEAWWEIKQPGADDPEDKGTMLLELDGELRETIDLLVKLQRWLGDAIAEKSLDSKKADELDKRLNDLTRVLGQNLYAVLFSGHPKQGDEQLSNVLLRQLEALHDEDLLRIRLEFKGKDAEELSSWPWEYMFIPADEHAKTGVFLASRAQLVLTRFIYVKGKSLKIATEPPIRVLLVCAAPLDLGAVQYEHVLKKMEELQRSKAIKLRKLIEPEIKNAQDKQGPNWRPTATFENFRKLVQEDFKPHVIHFIGHGQLAGGQGKLAFVGIDGKPDWRQGSDFAKSGYHRELKLVFLQACESALLDPHTPVSSVARQCAHQNVPAIIAMQAKIENEAARVFACTFYTELTKDKTVDCAVLAARQEMERSVQKQPGAFGIPVLYLRNYEKLIERRKPTMNVASEQRCNCPRCSNVINSADPKYCPYCALKFYCPVCVPTHKLVNPEGLFCEESGKPILQPPWQVLPPNIVPMPTDASPPQAPGAGKGPLDLRVESGN
jgi:hypothetical protein